jgi:uncharacterized repeat protein (TIGR03803 family)
MSGAGASQVNGPHPPKRGRFCRPAMRCKHGLSGRKERFASRRRAWVGGQSLASASEGEMSIREMSKRGVSVFAIVLLVCTVGATAARAQTYTDLFNFDGIHGADPTYPQILAQGRDGNLYGTAPLGDEHGFGVVFRVTPSGTPKILHDFSGSDGVATVMGRFLGSARTVSLLLFISSTQRRAKLRRHPSKRPMGTFTERRAQGRTKSRPPGHSLSLVRFPATPMPRFCRPMTGVSTAPQTWAARRALGRCFG